MDREGEIVSKVSSNNKRTTFSDVFSKEGNAELFRRDIPSSITTLL